MSSQAISRLPGVRERLLLTASRYPVGPYPPGTVPFGAGDRGDRTSAGGADGGPGECRAGQGEHGAPGPERALAAAREDEQAQDQEAADAGQTGRGEVDGLFREHAGRRLDDVEEEHR